MKYKKSKLVNKLLLIITNIGNKINSEKKVFFPSKLYYIENTNKNNNKTKRIIDILNAHNLYYHLYKKSIKENHIMEICEYIHKHYPYHEIHKKALLVGIYRLSLLNSFENIEKLQDILYSYYSNNEDPNITFGGFVLLYEKISHLSKNIQKNINIILDLQSSSHYSYCYDKSPMEIINYIVHYFLCEYYLINGIESFKANKYVNSIVFLKKILIRANSHPKCALEALLLMIEIFCILNSPLLIKKYLQILKEIYVLNKDEDYMKDYYLRGIYIITQYGFEKIIN
jgi:hypothetical protein